MGKDVVVLLAAHGVPATDYPQRRVGLLMAPHFSGKMVERIGMLRGWHEALDDAVRSWVRTPTNDPHNECCAPTVDWAIDRAVADGARQGIVLPTMRVRGNEHTERELGAAVARASERHPTVEIRYAWPFDQARLIGLLAAQASASFKEVS